MRRHAKAPSVQTATSLALCAGLLLILFLPPAAQASKGVVGWFGTEGNINSSVLIEEGDFPGQIRGAEAVAVNHTGAGGVAPGTAYVLQRERIDVLEPTGDFVSRWGWNVIGRNEIQNVKIDGNGGFFKLTFNGETTEPLTYNASSTAVRNALRGLSTIGSPNVEVHDSSFGPDPGRRLSVEYTGTLAGTDVEELTADGSELTGEGEDGGPPTVGTETFRDGVGGNSIEYEICTAAQEAECGRGDAPSTGAPLGAFSPQFKGGTSIAVDQTDGSVWIWDRGWTRVQKFDAVGNPLLTLGKDVNQSEAGTEFESCTAASGDICKAGASGTTGGAFGQSTHSDGNGLAVVPTGLANAGNLVVTDRANFRLQEFTGTGEFVRAFGWDVLPPASPDNIANNEVQEVTVPAAAGTFTLKFGSSTTPALPFNTSATEVETSLNGLSSVSSGGGSVSVSGGPGDSGGSSPYVVTFDGGPRADADVAELVANGRELGAASGTELTCNGPSVNATGHTDYQWLRNGQPISGATGKTYEITAADAGAIVQCQVFAFNGPFFNSDGVGSAMTQASVPPVKVAPLPGSAAPMPPAGNLPVPTATFLPGQSKNVGADGGYVLHCQTGSWSGSPTFTYQWYRSGVPLSGNGANTADYVVQPQDLESPAFFQCAVTGANANGAVTQMSHRASSFHPYMTSPTPSPTPPGSGSVTAMSVSDLPVVETTNQGASFEACTTSSECRSGGSGTSPGQFQTSLARTAVDADGAIYTVETFGDPSRVQKISPQPTPPSLAPSIFGSSAPPPHGAPNSSVNNYQVLGIAIDGDDHVLVDKRVASDFTPECLDGQPNAQERRVLEFSNDGSSLLATHAECAGLNPSDSGMAVNHATDDIYFPRGARVYILGEPSAPAVTIDTPQTTATNALVSGTVTPTPTPSSYPHPPGTSWRIEYRKSGASEWLPFRNAKHVGAGNAPVPYQITLTGLLPNTEYDVRTVATKEFNSAQSISPVRTFTTDTAPPAITAVRSSDVGTTSATLHATIDPRGSETTYRFEYGTTPEYGNVTSTEDIGDAHGGIDVLEQIGGLNEVTYHFRVVATNSAGTAISENQTFTFRPPVCPNANLRQQTGASYLPDCRAYELVSPGQAGNTRIEPYLGVPAPYATNPSRLSYFGRFAPLPVDGDPPNANDLYVATRTDGGWVSDFIGLPTTETYLMGGPSMPDGGFTGPSGEQANTSLDRILRYDAGNVRLEVNNAASRAPYVFDPHGNVVDRWPTNLNSVPNGEKYVSYPEEIYGSPDLGHFVFTANIPFASGAEPGDLYDNDTEAGTVNVINRDPVGAAFAATPVAISTDGSHILMMNGSLPRCVDNVGCGQIPAAELYMRTGGATLDVTKGHLGRFAGMTRDGAKVYFTSDGQATADDTDTSADLFMWQEGTDAVTRVSAGLGAGDTDDCDPVDGWTDACDVELVSEWRRAGNLTERASGNFAKPSFFRSDLSALPTGIGGNQSQRPTSDSFLAGNSGDIYFYSPEKLDGAGKGAAGLVNLYVFRGGAPRFVAALDPEPVCRNIEGITLPAPQCAEGPIARMNVTPTGSHAAFTATSQLTGYDNEGIEVMYRYNAVTDKLTCVSCIATGDAPTGPADGSQNGLFMSDDGRVFFATADALQPNDTNESRDVYEYVEGRAQLITPGTGSEKQIEAIGIEGSGVALTAVSADGVDVYFATFDTLVPQDHNGGNLKIYDARTNGGIDFRPPPAPCEAADECHAGSSSPPPPLAKGTGTNLGSAGNHRAARRCHVAGRKMRRLTRRARALRRRARAGGQQAQRLRKRAERATRKVRRMRKAVKRCRNRRKAHGNRGGAR